MTIMTFFYSIPIVFSQFYGWPTGGPEMDGTNLTINSTVYADNNRVRVTDTTHLGGNLYELDITAPDGVADISTLDLHDAGKWGFIIQMEDPNTNTTGQNTRIEFQSFTPLSSTTGKLTVVLPTGVIWPSFNFAANSRVQLIRVMVYENLYLQRNGKLTCHPYNHNDGTGGVVVFVTNGTTYFNGGVIDASAKGYYHNEDSIVLGVGGAGTPYNQGSPNDGYSAGIYPYARVPLAGGSLAPVSFDYDKTKNGEWCSDHPNAEPMPDIYDLDNINYPGQDGYGATNNGGIGTTTSGVVTYHPAAPVGSTAWDTLVMGKSGLPGSKAGDGGGAGGDGGHGGGNNIFPTGQPGALGQAGPKGGDVGGGARGGGIILLKTRGINKNLVSNAYPMLLAMGENGIGGENGKKGGDGGQGGLGADGGCNTDLPPKIVPPGEIGGMGWSGIGSGGGDGGGGGSSGSIWVMKKTSVSMVNHARWNAGNFGPAGHGGYSLRQRRLPLPVNYRDGSGQPTSLTNLICNTHDYYHCPPGCELKEVCDCDTVFEYLANEMSSFTIGNNTSYPYYLESGTKRLYYDPNYVDQKGNDPEKTLYFQGVGPDNCPVNFRCVMRNKYLFDSLMQKMFGVRDLESFISDPLPTSFDLGINFAEQPNSDRVNMDFIGYGENHRVFEYTLSKGELKDVDDPSHPTVYDGHCAIKDEIVITYIHPDSIDFSGEWYPTRIDFPFYEKTGPDGFDGTSGDFDGDNFSEDSDAPFIIPEDKNTIRYKEFTDFAIVKGISAVESSSIQITLDTEITTTAQYELYDIQGRLIAKGTINGAYTIQNLRRAVYFLKLQSGELMDVKKIGL